MKLESIIVENYRQFEKVELSFDMGITILAGANNVSVKPRDVFPSNQLTFTINATRQSVVGSTGGRFRMAQRTL